MKKTTLLLIFILFGAFVAHGQNSVNNLKKSSKTVREKFDPTRDANADLQEAIGKAQKENKRIILDIGGEWCGWCIHMDNYFLKNPKLAKTRDKNFVWVKVNMSDENENKEFLANYPQIVGYPHLFVLDSDGKFIHSQNTSELEQGKSYNLVKFTNFLKEWSPKK